jgi:hypothetical protein
MKNIHLISTDKPSRLWINNLLQGKLELHKEVLIGNNTAQNIYITSNNHNDISDEGINHVAGSWVLDTTRNKVYKTSVNIISGDDIQKIILTTDPDLIKDGVQAIDDEFLEWFVKNPSCESVEVSYGLLKPFKSTEKGYMIHLPDTVALEEPEQETLEEIILPIGDFIIENTTPIQGADGAYYHYSEVCKLLKLQDEKMYSEEDILDAWELGAKEGLPLTREKKEELFKQFKKSKK